MILITTERMNKNNNFIVRVGAAFCVGCFPNIHNGVWVSPPVAQIVIIHIFKINDGDAYFLVTFAIYLGLQ